MEWLVFDRAGKFVEAVTDEPADIGFIAVDPLLDEALASTTPYVLAEGFYPVRDSSPITTRERTTTVKAGHRRPLTCYIAYDGVDRSRRPPLRRRLQAWTPGRAHRDIKLADRDQSI